jgi:hypothetical protein
MRILTLAVVVAAFATGCGPSRPASFDFVPNFTANDLNCRQAELFVDDAVARFRAGSPPFTRYSDCYGVGVAATKFDRYGGPCPEPERYATLDVQALSQWLQPCVGIAQDANTYNAQLQDHLAREQTNAFSWRDALVLFAVSGRH